MSLLPSRPDFPTKTEPRVIGLDSEEADDLIAALSSTTARRLLAELHEEPAPPAELAERIDTTLQNAQYHLENLENAGAIEVVGTAYSEKGREMSVYGPADQPLVIFAGEQSSAPSLREALSQLFGGLLAIAFASAVIQQLFGENILDLISTPAEDAEPEPDDEVGIAVEEAATPTPEPEPTPAPEPTPTPTTEAIEPAVGIADAMGLPPGIAFFLGGAVVLTVIILLQYR